VQLHHRLLAYLLTVLAVLMGAAAWRSRYLARESKLLGMGVGAGVLLQASLGIATLMARAPLALSIAHQLLAALVFSLAIAFAWRVRRV
jgi:cytochrome c oxidase assembly protein subunit 15